MGFQDHKNKIVWKLHLASPRDTVFEALTTDAGRQRFWSEKTRESDGHIEFTFLNYPTEKSKILAKQAPKLFSLIYFGTEVTFELETTEDGGTDLTMTAITDNKALKYEMTAGWVSVLMAMKAALDFGVDLRNHHPDRTWDKGYLDN